MHLSQPLPSLLILLFSCAKGSIQVQARLQVRPIHHALQPVWAKNHPASQAFFPVSRMLEDEETDLINICTTDDSPNFAEDDDESLFYRTIFATDFEPTCTCSETDESQVAFLQNFKIGVNGTVNDFVALYNENVPGYAVKDEYICENTCESCFEDFCGILTTERWQYINFTETEITAEDIMTNGTEQQDFLALPIIEEGAYSLTDCIKYTSGYEGTLCIETANKVSNVTIYQFFDGRTCTITYNGEACNSCEIVLNDEGGCVLADCTNIQDGANIDSCVGTGMDGYFSFLQPYIQVKADNVTKGECDSAPPSPEPQDDTSGTMEASVGYILSAVVGAMALIM